MPLKAKVKATLSTRYSLSTSTLCQLCSRYVARPTCHHELTAAAKTAARSKKRRKKRRNRSTILSRPKALRGKKRRRDSPSRPSSPATLAASAAEPESRPSSTKQLPNSHPILRTCYLVIAFTTLVIIISATFGVAFTAVSWLVAVGTLISAVPIARHYPPCHCWRKPSIADGMRPIMRLTGFCMA